MAHPWGSCVTQANDSSHRSESVTSHMSRYTHLLAMSSSWQHRDSNVTATWQQHQIRPCSTQRMTHLILNLNLDLMMQDGMLCWVFTLCASCTVCIRHVDSKLETCSERLCVEWRHSCHDSTMLIVDGALLNEIRSYIHIYHIEFTSSHRIHIIT